MNIVIEETVINPILQIDEVADDVTISVQEIVEEYSISIEEMGIQGLKGDKGDTGSQGIQGEIGLTGLQGIQGAQGIQGEKGLQGEKGNDGIQGIQGEIGLTGLQGIQGIKGDKGDVGETGEQGIQGLKGDKGDTGEQGIQGLKGEIGLTGSQGIQGIQGEIGLTGKSAYQSALDGGFVGTELEFNTFLSEVDKLDNISGTNTGDETASTIINKIGDGSKINQSYLPSYVGDILEFDTVDLFPLVGELGKIYIVTTGTNINKQYRWTGSVYTQITNGLIASTNDVPEGINNLYFTVARFLSNLTATNIKNALGITTLSGSNTGDQDLSGKQNTLTNPLTGVGSELDPNTYALQDGTILYHSVKWFVPTSTVSTSGTTVTSVDTQFTSAMVGAKLTINGEWRIITAYAHAKNVTVASAYSQNYSGVVAGSWGVYSRCSSITSTGHVYYYSYQGAVMFAYFPDDQFNVRFSGFSMTDNGVAIQSGGALLRDSARIFWSNNATYYGTKDLGLRRNSAGVLEIYNGIAATGLEANRRDLLVRKITTSQIEINSTTQGFLPPRMTNAQRIAIASPAIGSVVYCTDATEGLYVNKSTGWTLLL